MSLGSRTCYLPYWKRKTKISQSRKYILIGIFSLGGAVVSLSPHASNSSLLTSTQQILCAVLNRITNFTAPYGSLVYLNWYIGETSTAVIVANVPHLWPLISRIFGLGSFKPTNNNGGYGSSENQYALASKRSGMSNPGRKSRRDFEKDGYVRSESVEEIAGLGMEQGKEDVELGQVSVTVTGGKGEIIDEEEGQGEWHRGKRRTASQGQIVKTVDVDQHYS